jgi:hypothetical protein
MSTITEHEILENRRSFGIYNFKQILTDIFEDPGSAYDSILKLNSSNYMEICSPGLRMLRIGEYKIAIIDNMSEWMKSECTYEETHVILSNNITEIPKIGFSYLENLKTIIIPSSVTSIGEAAFMNCRRVVEFTIPESVTSIGKDAFIECYALKCLTISDKLWNDGEQNFVDCSTGKLEILLHKNL